MIYYRGCECFIWLYHPIIAYAELVSSIPDCALWGLKIQLCIYMEACLGYLNDFIYLGILFLIVICTFQKKKSFNSYGTQFIFLMIPMSLRSFKISFHFSRLCQGKSLGLHTSIIELISSVESSKPHPLLCWWSETTDMFLY